MTWTTEKPIQPGWYWYRDSSIDDEPEIYKLFIGEHNGMPRMYVRESMGEGGIWIAYFFDGQWAGPLVPPEEG